MRPLPDSRQSSSEALAVASAVEAHMDDFLSPGPSATSSPYPGASPRNTPPGSPGGSFCEGPSSPVGSFHQGASQDGSSWQRDEDVLNCPQCRAPFSTTFRRHHCRQCGKIVCDDCSKHRVRIPKQKAWGKVRCCNACFHHQTEQEATGFEEDLAVNTEIIESLRKALKKSYGECEIFKRVLLELDADASGDRTLLEEHRGDPECDAAAFEVLKQRVQARWQVLCGTLQEQRTQQEEYRSKQEKALQKRQEVEELRGTLQTQRSELDVDLSEVSRVEHERDELERKKKELEEGLAAARRQVRELELERQARLDRQAQQRQRRNFGQLSNGSAPGSPGPAGHEAMAFTIASGREDSLLHGGRRDGQCVQSCRRSCAVQ